MAALHRRAAGAPPFICTSGLGRADRRPTMLRRCTTTSLSCSSRRAASARSSRCPPSPRSAKRRRSRALASAPLPVAQDAAVKMGAWQMVLWQPRWVYAEVDGLCYQKISTTEKPIGRPKKIRFDAIKEIDELDAAEFVLQCERRDYTFKAPTEEACAVLVHNLRQLRERANRA